MLLLVSLVAACGPRYAKSNVALGRVVIYRNGVAYYERRATVSDGELTVRVPRERVDDFLKSLTVVDLDPAAARRRRHARDEAAAADAR